MAAFQFDHGDKVRDLISGLEGIVTSRLDCITGCNQMAVNPQKLDDKGMPVQGTWVDEHRLVLVAKNALVIPNAAASASKGAVDTPPVR